MSERRVKHVIADSGAFIRNVPLQSEQTYGIQTVCMLGLPLGRNHLVVLPACVVSIIRKECPFTADGQYEIGESIYTLSDVVKEIKDKATIQRLQVLPYKLELRIPSQESIQFVTNFAKKTGDYKSLSAVDIKVIALTYQLEKEFVGTDHIKSAPDKQVEWNTTGRLDKPTDIAGFYLANNKAMPRTTSERLSETETCKQEPNVQSCDSHMTEDKTCDEDMTQNENQQKDDGSRSETSQKSEDNQPKIADTKEENEVNNTNIENNETFENYLNQQNIKIEEDFDESEEEDDDSNDDNDDEDGWITPSNIREVQKKMGEVPSEDKRVAVGCLTMDFAIQNVLIQMGLNVLSVEGYLIKRAKSYVLRCYACLKVTTNVMKEFCPFCGNNTLQKVSMTVDQDGSIRYFLSKRKHISTRGTKFALPLPKGGKHANNPILFEDQPLPQQRTTKKSKQKLDVFDPDYVAGSSPFIITDITSRASQLGIKNSRNGQFNKRNPNEVRKKYGKRK